MQNKTNQIVPEVTVELKGALIGWASKDKSSKKNVLEVCVQQYDDLSLTRRESDVSVSCS